MWPSHRFTHSFERRRISLLSVFTVALLGLQGLAPQAAWALGILYSVNSGSGSTADDPAPGDGFCETAIGNGVCTLRAALEESNGHAGTDGVRFNIPTSDPSYSPQTGRYTIVLSGALPAVTDSVNITGPGADKLTVYANGQRAFNVTTSGTVTFSGITIAEGQAPYQESGGGIQNLNGGTVNVTNCILSGNRSGGGPAPNGGGGISNASTGVVNVTGSILRNNRTIGTTSLSFGGAGIYNKSGTVTITNSAFEDNHSTARGGGIFNDDGVVTVTGSTFRGNGAFEYGGGIVDWNGVVNVSNSTFYANIAYGTGTTVWGSGGAIANVQNTLNLTNSTITENFAGRAGGGVHNEFGTVNVKSTLIAQNRGGTFDGRSGADVSGRFVSQGFNLIGKADSGSGFSVSTDRKGTIVSPLNPKFDGRGLRNNGGPTMTVALTDASPAVDRGTSASLVGTLTTDQRGAGFPRRVDKSVPNATGGDGTDIGAYELQ